MNTETGHICKKCLTRDMDQAEYFKNLHTYIENLDEDIKISRPLYEKRLAVCRECELLADGMCRACGCYVELRASIRVQKCPYSKWIPEKNETPVYSGTGL